VSLGGAPWDKQKLTACGKHLCADKCGVDWPGYTPWDEARKMTRAFYGYGSSFGWPPTQAGLVAALAAAQTSAQSECDSQQTYWQGLGWRICEDCAAIIADLLGTWADCDDFVVNEVTGWSYWDGSRWVMYKDALVVWTSGCFYVFQPPCSFFGNAIYVNTSAPPPPSPPPDPGDPGWTYESGFGSWSCDIFHYFCAYDMSWPNPVTC
jgi:hypothetical protein